MPVEWRTVLIVVVSGVCLTVSLLRTSRLWCAVGNAECTRRQRRAHVRAVLRLAEIGGAGVVVGFGAQLHICTCSSLKMQQFSLVDTRQRVHDDRALSIGTAHTIDSSRR